MNRRKLVLGILILALALPFSAEYFCKRYDFVQERYVKLNQKVGDLEILDLKFELPNTPGATNRCVATVKNYGSKRLSVNLAMALFDETGNLVGCGTTGTKLTGTRPGNVETFYINFGYVRTKILETKLFYITAETEVGQ
jgi:hypothetical protein